MYLRLRLENWRSIDDAEITLAPFTLLVGRNSSGKSNVVQALLFIHEVSRDAVTAVTRLGGISSIRRWSPSKPYQVRIELTAADAENLFESDSFRHKLVLHSGASGSWSFAREEIEIRRAGKPTLKVERDERSATFIGAKRSEVTKLVLSETTSAMVLVRQWHIPAPGARPPAAIRAMKPVLEAMRAPQPPSESARLSESAINIASALKAMRDPQRAEIVAAMRQIVPGLKDIRAEAVGRYLTLMFTQEHAPNRRPEFAGTEMSDGALRALAIITAAVQMGPNEVLVVEEPEVSLHPGAAHVLYDVLHSAARRGTVLVTTHSPELLDQAGSEEILVCSYEDGRTQIGPLAQSQRALVREGLFSVAELMRSDDLRREGSAPEVVQDRAR